ncbi:MAG: PLDc N-terminal domain-containing protein [Blastocatellia bacterium]|nr:PLDc N-terminal domain-containing protein [Blastocatellia bacterium]
MVTLFNLIAMALYIISIGDVVGSSTRSLMEKIVLVVLILAFPVIGPIVYMMFFREKK